MASPFRLKTALGDDVLRVHACASREALSDLGETTLTLLSERKDIRASELLGKAATLTMALRDDAPRQLAGYVTRFAQTGFEGRHTVYQMTLRPWLWLLTRTADCRIFQEMTVPDIVRAVFDDHPVARHEFKLMRAYRPWTYCVQYRETDFNFVARLLENEGIYWYFTHDEAGHTLVLTDAASAHDCAPGCESLPFYGSSANVPPELEYVDAWITQESLKPGKVVITDFDFERPSSSLEKQQDRTRDYDLSDGEVFDYPGGYLQAGDGAQYAEDRLDEIQTAYARFDGDTNAQGVRTGHLLSLERHPRDDQNAKYLVTGTTIQMRQAANESASGESDLRCRFSAIPADQQFRPERRTPKPMAPGPQTAIVTGPSGEEIFTDKYGRVKVQFHWDRRGKRNESSSCWIRVSQPWAGKGWGGVSIPRIGQEVVVDFVEGDPDQPLITGRVYNAEQMPPYDLPANKTQSGIKTRSSKSGSPDNFNEIRFEDLKGSEQLYIHAEKNKDQVVENDETQKIGHDRSESVGHDEKISIGHDRTETVANNETISIGVNRTETVGSNEAINIGSNRSISVGASETASVALQRTHSVGVNETISVGAAQEITVGAAQAITVGANQSTNVGANRSISVGGNQSVDVGGDESVSIGKNQSVSVGEGRSVNIGKDDGLTVGKMLSINAGDEITIVTGDASITMKKDGTIIIKGKDITLDGSGKVNVKADGDITMKGSKIKQN